jgi:hypothetical protein
MKNVFFDSEMKTADDAMALVALLDGPIMAL